jgi:hypothetical protein
MSFGTGYIADPQKVGGGERYGENQVILTALDFEDGLKVGRFAKLDTGSIDNLDGSVSPVLAGVVLRNVANAVESGATIDAALFDQIEYERQGLVTVDAKSGETPTLFDRIYVSNAGDANDGLATVTNTDEPVNAEYIATVQTNVWLVYINPAPGDIAAHTGDALAAHAASAISLLDAAGQTATVNLETAIAEILLRIPATAAIADPGDAGAIPVTRSGVCAITTAAAETRTMAIPAFIGEEITLCCDVHAVGNAVVTVASAINQTGNTIITLNTAGDTVVLKGVQVGGVLAWRVVVNDGAALS